jgi:trimethylamine---corrinoid protein Co-methyltransferase
LETIRKTCLEGPGHFLGADQTLRLMQTEYVYPAVGDRMSPKEWAEQGKPGYIQRAAKKTRAILDRHFPPHVPEAVDDAIRERFPVRLPKEQMRPSA